MVIGPCPIETILGALGLGIGKDSANDVGADDGPHGRCQHKQHLLRGRAATK